MSTEIFIPRFDDDKPIIDSDANDNIKDTVIDSPVDNVEDVDNSNNVVDTTSSDQPDDSQQVDQIDIDGVIYNLDANGNAVDSSGTIKYSKEDIEKFEGDTNSLDVSSIAKLTNIVPVDDSGELINYENTPEGIAKYVSDVYSIASNQAVSDFQNSLFSTYPILFDVINHLEKNSTLDGFTKTVDYSSLTLDENNEIQLSNIIKEARALRGEDNAKIEKYITYLKDSNSLFTDAQEELKYLVEVDNNKRAEQSRIEAEQANIAREDAQNYWGVSVNEKGQLLDLGKPDSILGIIKSGKLKIGEDVYNIPDKIRVSDGGQVKYYTKTDFFNYLYNPIEVVINNEKIKTTAYQLDLHKKNSSRSINDEVFDAFKQFVKFDNSQFIKEAVNQQNVRQVIKKINSKQNRRVSTPIPSGKSEIVIPRYE
jgi:hypothetical protein